MPQSDRSRAPLKISRTRLKHTVHPHNSFILYGPYMMGNKNYIARYNTLGNFFKNLVAN